MDDAILANLGAFALQTCAIVAAAALLVWLLQVSSPATRYTCWRMALFACLVMPWLLIQQAELVQPPEPGTIPGLVTPVAISTGIVGVSDLRVPPAPAAPLPWDRVVVFVILAGATVRATWLTIGWLRLRRLRTRAVAVEDEDYREIQALLGTQATLKAVEGLTQPATFGLRRPVVLIPAGLADSPATLRRAVVTHELFHVQRRDWLWVIGEELLRTMLWFHPAILWLTSRIQLAREEVVDELTVLATGNRRAYIEALCAFADAGPVRPAPAFARRQHLFTRIVGLSKEREMSAPRVVLSIACVLAALVLSAWYAGQAFPILSAAVVEPASAGAAADVPLGSAPSGSADLPAPPPQGARGAGAARPGPAAVPPGSQVPTSGNQVTPENPIPRRIFSVAIPYPQELQGSGYAAAVEVRVVVDANGATTVLPNRLSLVVSNGDPSWTSLSSRVVAGDQDRSAVEQRAAQLRGIIDASAKERDAFRAAVLQSISQWRYDSPVDPPIEFWVAVTFAPGKDGVVTQSAEDRGVSAVGGRVSVGTQNIYGAAVDPAGRVDSGQLAEIDRLQLDLQKRRALLLKEFQPSHPEVVKLDSQFRELALMRDRVVKEVQSRTLSAPTPVPLSQAPLRVGGDISPPTNIRRVNPQYPPDALAERVQGVVIMEVTIDEAGRVADARVLRSIPLLDQAAIDAVRQWEFTPTLLNGVAVPIIMTVTIQFTMPPSPQAF